MERLFLPLLIGILSVGTLIAAVTQLQRPGYRQDPRAAANSPLNPSPISLITPISPITPTSFYANNTIVIEEESLERAPANSFLFTLVQISQPGFLIIRENAGGRPGETVAASPLLPAGRNEGISLQTSRLAQDKELLFASLHADDGDGIFSAAADTLLLRDDGRPAQISFIIDAEE